LIGRGAYGEVWLARAITGVYRAVKIISRSKFSEAGPFEREFRGLKEFAAISVKEPSQLAVLHVGRNEDVGFFYYVMELADDVRVGRAFDPAAYQPATLAGRRAARRRLSTAECTAIGIALAQALSALHSRGLVHRDIKPANIVFVGGQPKLADIGLVATATEALTYVGTDGYIPPEGPGTPAADVYSLGRVLYELTTGLDLAEFPRLPSGWEDDPDQVSFSNLNRVVLRAADPMRDRRYPSADQMLADLTAVAAGKKVDSGWGLRRRVAKLAFIAGSLLVLALAIAGLIRWRAGATVKPDQTDALVARALHLSRTINFHREDLVAAENFARTATELQRNSAAAWGARAWVEAAFIQRHWDEGAARKREAEELANHALSLNPAQADALEALGEILIDNKAGAAAEPLMRRAVQAAPEDFLAYGLLADSLAEQGHPEQAIAIVQATARRFPTEPLPLYKLAGAETWLYRHGKGKQYAELAIAHYHRISALQPMAYALIAEARFDLESTGDLNDMRQALNTLETFPLEDRADDRAIYYAALGCLVEGHPAAVAGITALTSRRYLEDSLAAQPVAWLNAMAEIQQSHLSSALIYWQDAEAVLREKIRDDSDDAFKTRHYAIQLATTLVRLGRREEAAKLAAPIEAITHDGLQPDLALDLARYYLACGDTPRAMVCGRAMHLHPYELKYDPWWAPVRMTSDYEPFFQELVAKSP
jgi:serine/threonine protein kinase